MPDTAIPDARPDACIAPAAFTPVGCTGTAGTAIEIPGDPIPAQGARPRGRLASLFYRSGTLYVTAECVGQGTIHVFAAAAADNVPRTWQSARVDREK